MAHLYQMAEDGTPGDLFENCLKYLEKNITKENAVEAWKAAIELLGGPQYTKLAHQALDTIFRVNLHDISRSFANKTLGPPIFKIVLCFSQTRGFCNAKFLLSIQTITN